MIGDFDVVDIVLHDLGDGVPRMRDIELGERLGYARPRAIRHLISELHGQDFLSNIRVCHATRQTSGGRPSKEYWLDEEGAMLVVTQSGMPVGVAFTLSLIRAFREFKLQPQHQLFARQLQDWHALWRPHIIQPLCELYGNGHLYTPGGRLPGGWFSQIERRIYEHVWDAAHVAEAMRRLPNPRHHANWHQLLTGEARRAFAIELDLIAEMAFMLLNHTDPVPRFWEWMAGHYRRQPFQLEVPGAFDALPPPPKPKRRKRNKERADRGGR